MSKTKTQNLLTVLLFLVIAIIIICIGYFSYEIVYSNIKIKTAENAVDEFDREYPTIADAESEEGSEETDGSEVSGDDDGTAEGDDDEEYVDDDVDDDDGSGSSGSTKKKKKKKTTSYSGSGGGGSGGSKSSGGGATITTTTVTTKSGKKKKVVKINGFTVIGTIRIPAIGVKYPVLKSVSKKALDTAVCMLHTEKGLNKAGTTVIIGHNYRNWQFFSKNDKLKKGDIIYLKDTSGKQLKYKVTKIFKAASSDASFYTSGGSSKKTLILSTCTDDAAKTNKRLIVKAVATK